MNKLRNWLGAALAVQCLLAAALLWAGRPADGGNAQQPLLSFTPAEIDRIVIREGEQSATIARKDGKWQLPGLFGLPAKQEDVEQLLGKLEALRTGWPVATSDSSHSRFQVAEDENQRHISLYHGEETAAELFLGSSPGLRQVHLRRPGDDKVYVGELPTHEVPANSAQWLDTQLLAAGVVTSVKGPDYQLQKHGDNWALVESEDTVDAAKAKQLASALEDLRVSGVAEEAPPEDAEKVTLEVTANGKQWQYTFTTADDKHYVSRNDRDVFFTLTSYNFDRIAGVDQQALIKPQEQKPETQTAAKEDQKDKG